MSLWDSFASDLDLSSDDGYGDGGVTNNTGSYTSAPPDASGGSGSFLSALLPTLTTGLNAALNSTALNSLGKNSALYTVDAYGNLVPKAAAGYNNASYAGLTQPVSPFTNPVVLLGLGAVVLVLIIAVAHK